MFKFFLIYTIFLSFASLVFGDENFLSREIELPMYDEYSYTCLDGRIVTKSHVSLDTKKGIHAHNIVVRFYSLKNIDGSLIYLAESSVEKLANDFDKPSDETKSKVISDKFVGVKIRATLPTEQDELCSVKFENLNFSEENLEKQTTLHLNTYLFTENGSSKGDFLSAYVPLEIKEVDGVMYLPAMTLRLKKELARAVEKHGIENIKNISVRYSFGSPSVKDMYFTDEVETGTDFIKKFLKH